MKFFTVEEAEAVIPELEKVFAAIDGILAQARAKAKRVEALEESRGSAAELALERGQVQFLSNAIDEWLRKVAELGGVPKGLDPGLVDFPGRLEGRSVFLCWRRGEKSITQFHGIDEGFGGRRPLPRRRPS